MIESKQKKTFIIGIISTILGVLLRISARSIAWPNEYGYSGPRENTIWAIKEQAYQDIGMLIMMFGLAVLIVLIVNWLWMPKSLEKK